MKRTYQTSQDLPEDLSIKTMKQLRLGYLNLEEEMFEQAKMNFQLALEYDEKCADAYWGLMLVKFQLKNEDKLYDDPMTFKSAIYLPECEKALELADENQKKIYNSLLEGIMQVNAGDEY